MGYFICRFGKGKPMLKLMGQGCSSCGDISWVTVIHHDEMYRVLWVRELGAELYHVLAGFVWGYIMGEGC